METTPTPPSTPDTKASPAARKRGKRLMPVYLIGAAAGAALGFAYYRLIGCRTGACPLTSTLYGALIYGAVLGALVSGLFASRRARPPRQDR